MNKTLLAITTFNQWSHTRHMLESIFADKNRKYDVILIDDYSIDGTIRFAKNLGIKIITKPAGRGCTDSWNLAYQYFRFNDYDNLFIANNDCLVPVGCMDELIKNMEDGCLVVPLTTFYGSGDNKICSLNTYHPDIDEKLNCQTIQDKILKSDLKPIKDKVDWAAFLFGMNRSALLREKWGNLFTPYNINIHQEREMKNKFTIKIVPTAFALHLKAVTLAETDNSRNDLSKYHKDYTKPTEGEMVIKWVKEGNDYRIDNVFAYPFTLLHVINLLTTIIHVSSVKLMEDMYGEQIDSYVNT